MRIPALLATLAFVVAGYGSAFTLLAAILVAAALMLGLLLRDA